MRKNIQNWWKLIFRARRVLGAKILSLVATVFEQSAKDILLLCGQQAAFREATKVQQQHLLRSRHNQSFNETSSASGRSDGPKEPTSDEFWCLFWAPNVRLVLIWNGFEIVAKTKISRFWWSFIIFKRYLHRFFLPQVCFRPNPHPQRDLSPLNLDSMNFHLQSLVRIEILRIHWQDHCRSHQHHHHHLLIHLGCRLVHCLVRKVMNGLKVDLEVTGLDVRVRWVRLVVVATLDAGLPDLNTQMWRSVSHELRDSKTKSQAR